MIKTRDLVPEVYYNKSRDFQALGRVLEVLYAYVKTNADLIEGLPLSDNCDLLMINLLTTTLGFTRKHAYNSNDLMKICKVFSEIVRLKGTKKAIEYLVNSLINAQNIDKETFVEKKNSQNSLSR